MPKLGGRFFGDKGKKPVPEPRGPLPLYTILAKAIVDAEVKGRRAKQAELAYRLTYDRLMAQKGLAEHMAEELIATDVIDRAAFEATVSAVREQVAERGKPDEEQPPEGAGGSQSAS